MEHESVVARPTFCRTLQIENQPLHEGKEATLPSTINAKGALVSKVVHPELRRGTAGGAGIGMGDEGLGQTGSGIELTGSFAQGIGEYNEMGSPSTHSRNRTQQNRIVEIDVPGQQQGRGRSGSAGNGGISSPVAGSAMGFNRSHMSTAGEPRTGSLTKLFIFL